MDADPVAAMRDLEEHLAVAVRVIAAHEMRLITLELAATLRAGTMAAPSTDDAEFHITAGDNPDERD